MITMRDTWVRKRMYKKLHIYKYVPQGKLSNKNYTHIMDIDIDINIKYSVRNCVISYII